VHGVRNATSGLIPRLAIETISDPWFSFKTWAVVGILLIAFTRGELDYRSPAKIQESEWAQAYIALRNIPDGRFVLSPQLERSSQVDLVLVDQ
jgi:hypothetical protein